MVPLEPGSRNADLDWAISDPPSASVAAATLAKMMRDIVGYSLPWLVLFMAWGLSRIFCARQSLISAV